MRKQSTLLSSKKKVIIASAALLIVAAGGIYWMLSSQSTERQQVKSDPVQSLTPADVRESSPVEREIAEKKNQGAVDRPLRPAPGTGESKTKVTPIVTGFGKGQNGQFEVDGGVNEIVENGGTCRFTLSWRGGEMSRESTAYSAPSSTSCATAVFDTAAVPEGAEATLRLTYTSSRYEGASNNNPLVKKEEM